MDSNTVVNAITETLRQGFPKIKIYTEQTKQGFKEPCFFIWEYNASFACGLSNKRKNTFYIVIRYFDDKYEDMRGMTYKLSRLLEVVRTDEAVFRCRNAEYRIEDGVLHYYVKVASSYIENKTKVPMRELEVNEYGKTT